uniref:cysteine dioxygenase n=1 Tax=Oryza sativa subsp. japonica TaxID=39947 RepID=Q5ZA03_ORYSJ|nr:HGWP repeat containing protein-like [Oryza sativa Japonica Group]
MPPLLGVYVFTDRPPRPPPTGASACTAGLLCRRCWASTSSPTGLPSPLPTGASACTAGLLCRRCWASTSSPTGRLVRRRLVLPPARLAYYAAVVGRLRLHQPAAASATADWCFRLHGWPLCRRCWASTSSPTGLPSPLLTGVSACTAGLYAAVVGRLRLHRPAASSAADWCFRLHGWPIMPPLLGVYVFTDRLAFAAADWCFRLHGWPLCRRCWASTSSPTGRLVRRRLVLPPARLAYYAAVVGRLRLHRPACLHRCRLVFPPARLAFMPPLLGVYVFTDRLAFAAADWCFRLHGWPLCRRCWASTSSPTGRLVRRRLVLPPTRLAYYAAVVGRLRLHRPAASSAADWWFRLHGWPIMPPLLGVYVFTDRLAFAAADWCFRLHGWPLCRRCWASTSSPTGLPSPLPTGVSACTAGLYAAVVGRLRLHRPACLRRCRLVFPPARLAFMPPLLGVYVFTDRLAFAAADWCFRLHGWPLCRRCWASTSSPTGLPSPLPTGVSACTAGLYAAVVGRLRRHRPAASSAADWCFRLHGWPIMLPLLGVYVFTDRPPRPPPTGASACTAGLLCRRCWASTSSPTGLPSPLPTGVSACTAGLYAAVVGRLRLHRPACLRRCRLVFPPARLAFMPPLLGVYVVTDRPPRPPPTGASAYTAGLLCCRCWASTSSPTGRLVRRRLVLPPARLAYYAAVVGRLRRDRPACLRRCRLVFPPARLAFMPPLLGVYVFTDRLAFAAADWCFRLHGWPLCRRCWASTSSPTGLPSPLPTGVSACTAGLYAAVIGRLRLHRPACLRRCRLVFPPARLAFMPPLLGVYVFTDRPPRPPPTGASACTAGLLCCRCWASTSSPTGRRIRR